MLTLNYQALGDCTMIGMTGNAIAITIAITVFTRSIQLNCNSNYSVIVITLCECKTISHVINCALNSVWSFSSLMFCALSYS